MKKSFSATLVLLLLLALPLLAGGTGQQQSATPQAQRAEASTLTLWVYDTGRIDVLTKIGQEFEAEYGVKVEVTLVDLGELRNQMILATRGGGEAADMAIIPHDNLGTLVANDAVLPISLGNKTSSYLAPSIQGFTYNGSLYGLPLAVENIALFYNKDMVPNPPATLDELYSVGKALVDQGKADYIMGYPDATYNVFPVYTAFGGYIFGADANGIPNPNDIGLDKTGFVRGLEYLTKLVHEGYSPEAIDWDGAHVLFETGRAPFVMSGPWALNRFQTAGVNYGIAAFPSGGAPFLGVQGVVVSAASPNALLAQTFLTEFLATEKNMQAIFDAEQRPSAWKSIFEGSTNPDVAGFNAAGPNAIPMPSIPEMGFVWDAWVNAAALAFSGELSPQQALTNAVNQIRTQIAEQ